MSWTKRQFIESAFSRVGLAGYIYDMPSQQYESSMRTLDMMMATWNATGIRLSYPLPSSPQNSDLDAETNVPDSAVEAIVTNLGIRIAPEFGKIVSPDLKQIAKEALSTLSSLFVFPMERQFPSTLPLGAGNNSTFADPPTDPLVAGPDSELEFE